MGKIVPETVAELFYVEKRIEKKYDLLAFIHNIPADRTLRIRRRLRNAFADTDGGGGETPLDVVCGVHKYRGNFADDTGTYRHQYRHLLWIYCRL